MAEEKKPAHNPMNDVLWFIGVIVVLVFLWYMAGGPSRADLGGILLHAPEPLDSGDSYGPNPQPSDTYYTVPPPQQISTTTNY